MVPGYNAPMPTDVFMDTVSQDLELMMDLPAVTVPTTAAPEPPQRQATEPFFDDLAPDLENYLPAPPAVVVEAMPLPPLPPPDLPPVPDSDSEDDQLDDDTEEEDDEDPGDDDAPPRHAAAMGQGRHGASTPSRRRSDSDRADRARPAGPGPTCAVAFFGPPATSTGSRSAWHDDALGSDRLRAWEGWPERPSGWRRDSGVDAAQRSEPAARALQVRQLHARGLL